MEITRILNGTLEEMEDFFNENNTVRNHKIKKDDSFIVTLRVNDDFKEPRVKTISAYRQAIKILKIDWYCLHKIKEIKNG